MDARGCHTYIPVGLEYDVNLLNQVRGLAYLFPASEGLCNVAIRRTEHGAAVVLPR
jgi:hypothetical protein